MMALKHWMALRLFDRQDALNHEWRFSYWKVRPRRWGHQLMRCARTK
jgi:hypothetical protein